MGGVTTALQYGLAIPVILHESVEISRVSLSEKTPEVLKGFGPGVIMGHGDGGTRGALAPPLFC